MRGNINVLVWAADYETIVNVIIVITVGTHTYDNNTTRRPINEIHVIRREYAGFKKMHRWLKTHEN